MTPLMAWRAAVEAAHSASELALQLRVLDAALRWDALKCAPAAFQEDAMHVQMSVVSEL